MLKFAAKIAINLTDEEKLNFNAFALLNNIGTKTRKARKEKGKRTCLETLFYRRNLSSTDRADGTVLTGGRVSCRPIPKRLTEMWGVF